MEELDISPDEPSPGGRAGVGQTGDALCKPVAQAAVKLRVGVELSIAVNERGYVFGRKDGNTGAEIQMNANSEPGVLVGQNQGVLAGGLIDHEGGAGDQAVAVGQEDAVGDAAGPAEVVGIDDEALS